MFSRIVTMRRSAGCDPHPRVCVPLSALYIIGARDGRSARGESRRGANAAATRRTGSGQSAAAADPRLGAAPEGAGAWQEVRRTEPRRRSSQANRAPRRRCNGFKGFP